jgi:hypothetical protein
MYQKKHPLFYSPILFRPLIRLTAVVAALAVLNSVSSLDAAIFNLSVPSTTPWTDTGIFVNPGTTLNIQASGTVVYGSLPQQATGPGGTNYDGQQFFPGGVLPTTTIVSLIGKIGGTTATGTGTPVPQGVAGNGPGYVGSSYNQFINTGGELFLGFNDQITAFGDNSGSFAVTVTTVAIPEPSSGVLAGLIGIGAVYGITKRRMNADQKP